MSEVWLVVTAGRAQRTLERLDEVVARYMYEGWQRVAVLAKPDFETLVFLYRLEEPTMGKDRAQYLAGYQGGRLESGGFGVEVCRTGLDAMQHAQMKVGWQQPDVPLKVVQ